MCATRCIGHFSSLSFVAGSYRMRKVGTRRNGMLYMLAFTSTPWNRTHHGIVFIFIFSEDKVCFEVGF